MELLAYADPVFGRRQVVTQTRENRNKLVDIARSLYRERGMKLDPLPYTREEVKNIAALYPRKASKVYVGPAATEASVKRENLDHFNCLHFATHGLIDEEVPARSGVVLSLVGEKEEDGILQMNEIFNLDLSAELVVLSACQTGLGKLVKGEGMIGLTRAFMYAGASSVVVSLWNVRDSSTAEFMKSFYRHLRVRKDKAEALRQAKLDMIRSDIPAYRFPYFWAPFVVIGQP
jgi:CHAT domain-containing protein